MTDNPTKAIVCVDDEAIIIMSLKAQLRNHYKNKFLIETSLSGEEAINVIEDLKKSGVYVHMLISDWNMPGMRGDKLFSIIAHDLKGPVGNLNSFLNFMTSQYENISKEDLKGITL